MNRILKKYLFLITNLCYTAKHLLQNAYSILPTKKLHTAYYILFILLTANCQLTHAQLFPVQVNQSIVPPYNTKLNSYATATDVKLRLFLTLTDINVSNRQVRLKLKIQGQGLSIQSTDFVTSAPQIFLNGGSQQQFTNIDLAPYFQLNNLLGINPQQYNQPLPDGTYRICWEVYDFLTNQRISSPNMGCTNIFLLLNDPPFLNLPNRGDQLTDVQPTNIIFQWTPRHANATNVSYEFELREIWDEQIDPQAGFLASPNYHTETTFSTTLLYNVSKPQLFPGRTYAWRVRAKSTTGLSENSVFRNNGYSEIFYFTFTNQCFAPTFTLAEPLNTGTVKISWQAHPDHNKFNVQYKRADVADAEWFEISSYNNQAQIANLQDGVTYNFRVGGTCHALTDFNQGFSYSGVNQFTMPTADESVTYSCGIIPEIDVTNTNPLGNLGVNETFTAGDFPVTVKQIQGGNGVFTGKGFIVVPYLADTKIAVEFSAIKINTDYQLFGGIIKTTYDPTWSSVEDTGDWTGGGPGGIGAIDINFPLDDLPDGIQIDPNGDILLVGEGGAPIVELPGGKDYVITDGSDPKKKYSIDEDGNITELGEEAEGGSSTAENTDGVNSDGEATSISAQGVEVTFTKAPNNVYGFDGYESSQSITKDLYKKLGNNYYMPYKAVAKGQDDYIIANLSISDTNIQPQDLIFKTKDGVALTKIDSTATTYTFKLTGTLSDADVETQAVIKQGEKYQIAGAFMQYQVATKDVDVVLVNTSNTSTEAIKTNLKRIYKQAMVNLTITEINNFDINSYVSGSSIESGESGFLANYTNQQQSINSAIKSRSDYNQSAYYLILTEKNPSTVGEKGLMPIGRQFGYIYDITANTIAHELGHGAFQLKHPFSTHSYGWAENATNWLLDYNNGEHLPYAHWKNIHNPNIHIGIFDGDSEGELGGGIWLTANWKPFSFNESRTIFDPPGLQDIPIGSVPGIKYNDTTYVSNGDNYSKDGNDLQITLYNNLDDNKYVNLFRDNGGCGTDSYYKVKWKDIKNKQNNISFDDTTIEYQDIIPCNSSNNTSSTCSGFQEISEVNVDDKIAIADLLLEKFNARNQITSKIRTEGTFNHIVFDGSIAPTDNQKLEILEEKLFLLKAHTGVHMTVIMHRIQNNNLYTQEAANELAQQAITQAGLENENIVLLAIPNANYESILWETSNACIRIGLGQSGGTHATSHTFTSDVFNSILNTYSSISKPYYLNYFFLASDGSLVDSKITSTQNKTGLPYINNIRPFESPRRTDLELKRSIMTEKSLEGYQAKQELENLQNVLNTYEHYWDSGYESTLANVNAKKDEIVQLQSEYQSLKIDYNQSLLQFMEEDLVAFETGNISYWQPLEQGIGKFRECYMTDDALVRSYMVKEVQDRAFGQQLDIVLGLSTLESYHFYAFDKWVPIDTAVYGAIDVAGFFPLIGEGADVAGVLYSGLIRGNYTNAAMYSAGLAIPFVSGGVFKASDNLFVAIAKKSDDGSVQYLVRRTDEVIEGELQIFSIIATTRNQAETLMSEALPHVDHNGIEEFLNRIADLKHQADEIVNHIDVIFSDEQVDYFVSVSSQQNENEITKVMFGRWDDGAPSSYVTRAGDDHSYFAMGEYWEEAKAVVNNGVDHSWMDEIWKINKKYIDNQKALNKEFYFSHYPFSAPDGSYYAREINYLIDLGVTDFQQVGDNIWKAIW